MRIARPLTAAAVTLALAAGSPAALAQSPFAPLPQAAPPQTQTTAAPKPAVQVDDGSIDTGLAIAIFGGALVLLAGIVLYIYRDARVKAPVAAGHTAHDETPKGAPHAKKRKARAQGKRAKAARRRNR